MNPSRNKNIKVLMYHRLFRERSDVVGKWHFVCVKDFRRQLKIVEALNYTPITFVDYKLYLDDELTLPKKPIIITFDDGYRDTYELALPILMEFNMTAVIFALGNRRMERAFWDEEGEDDACPLMSDEQLANARSFGFEIGAHSMQHVDLTLTNEMDLRNEIEGSKEAIEAVLGEEIQTFAYPYGRLNKKVLRITAESGYTFGCGVYTGPPKFGDDMYNFRRLAVNQKTGPFQFLLRLATPYEYLEWFYFICKEMATRRFGNPELNYERTTY